MASNYGTDIASPFDADLNLMTGTYLLAWDLAWRAWTAQGELFTDPTYGAGVGRMLGEIYREAEWRLLMQLCQDQARADDRVKATQWSHELDPATRKVTVRMLVTPTVGETFTAIMSPTAEAFDLEVLQP